MAFVRDHPHVPGAPVLIGLEGAAVPGDETVFAETASAVLEAGERDVYLDCRGLTSMSGNLAREVTRLRRSLLDRDGRLIFVEPNVVVQWTLRRAFGALSFDEGELPEAYRAVPSPRWEDEEEQPLVPPPCPPADTARPHGPSPEAVRALLDTAEGPAAWCGPLDELIGVAGLGSRVHLFHREGPRLRLASRADHAFESDGWLGSFLAMADRPVAVSEIGPDELSPSERAVLLWSGADVLVPVVADGRLLGVLTLVTGREFGYQALRSGEILALALLGELLAGRLAARGEQASAAPEPLHEATPEPEPIPEPEPELLGV